jgi:simple sugar transport system permease protein
MALQHPADGIQLAAPALAPVGPPPGERGFFYRHRVVLFAVAGVAALSIVRAATDVNDLTSAGAFNAALRFAMPIGLAGLGGIYAERAGVINIGLEGMMILGTWFGAWAGFQWGPWWGVLAGMLGGAAGGLVLAIAAVSFDVNHIVAGVAINILGLGVARFLSSLAFTPENGGGITQSPIVSGSLGRIDLPFLAGGTILGWQSPDILASLARHHWIFVSDVAGMARGIVGGLSSLTLVCVLLFPFTAWLLWRTRFGLRLRSVGESPMAAETLGVDVYRMKYTGVIISGGFAGLAGAYLVLVSSGQYHEGQTGGRGFIGLAAMIFGNWRPLGVAVGAGLFGFADALQNRSNAATHALVLLVAIAAAGFAILYLVRKDWWRAALAAAIGFLFFIWWATTSKVPDEFVTSTPYVVTLVVLAAASQRLRPPAADGLPYRKGQTQ